MSLSTVQFICKYRIKLDSMPTFRSPFDRRGVVLLTVYEHGTYLLLQTTYFCYMPINLHEISSLENEMCVCLLLN